MPISYTESPTEVDTLGLSVVVPALCTSALGLTGGQLPCTDRKLQGSHALLALPIGDLLAQAAGKKSLPSWR